MKNNLDDAFNITPTEVEVDQTEVKSITSTDNALVEEGDDFVFSGTSTWNG